MTLGSFVFLPAGVRLELVSLLVLGIFEEEEKEKVIQPNLFLCI